MNAIGAKPRSPDRLVVARRIAVRVARVLLLALLAYLVVSQLHWRDRVLLQDGRTLPVVAGIDASGELTVATADTVDTVRSSEILVRRPGLATLVQRFDAVSMIAAVLLLLPVPFLTSPRFYHVTRGLGLETDLATASRINLSSYVYNLVGPASAGGDVYRLVALRGGGRSMTDILGAVTLDRIAGSLALVLSIAITAALALDDPRFAPLASWALAGVGLASAVIAGLCGWRPDRTRARARWLGFLLAKAAHYRAALATLAAQRARSGTITALTLTSQALNLLSIYVIARALEIEPAAITAFLIYPAAMLLGAVAPTPQGLGAVEGFLALTLAPHVGGGISTCVVLAFVVRVVRLVWAVPGAVLTSRSLGGRSG